METQFILRQMGSLQGKKLLDIRAGLGESSVYFALKGASVTTVNVSPRIIETALSLEMKFGIELDGIIVGVEDLDVPDGSFDLVYIADTIHLRSESGITL